MQASDEKPFSIPEIDVWMDESEYIQAIDLIGVAASLAGDGAGGELGANAEYERGMAELILRRMGWEVDLIDQVIAAIHVSAMTLAGRRLSRIQKRARDGEPIYVVKGGTSGDPDVWGPDVPEGTTEWQFSDGPAGERDCSEDYLDLLEGIEHFCKTNPRAVFIFDL